MCLIGATVMERIKKNTTKKIKGLSSDTDMVYDTILSTQAFLHVIFVVKNASARGGHYKGEGVSCCDLFEKLPACREGERTCSLHASP